MSAEYSCLAVDVLFRALLLLLVLVASIERKAAELEPDDADVPLPVLLFEIEGAAAAGPAVAGVVVDGEDDEAGVYGEPALAVLGDAVQRLLLYMDLLGRRAQLVHTLSRLIRDIIQGLFRMGEDFVCARSSRGGQFFYLRVQLPYHPLQALPAFSRVSADVLGEHVFHVPVQRNTLDLHGGLLFEQRFARIRRVWNVAECLVHGQEAAKGEVDRLKGHQSLRRIYRGLLAGVTHVR